VSWGGVAGARVVEQLREVAIELQMAPIRNAVHIPSFWTLLDEKGNLKEGALDQMKDSSNKMLDQLIWWAKALKNARDMK
jgi:NAD(P)H-dependent FMN reductase